MLRVPDFDKITGRLRQDIVDKCDVCGGSGFTYEVDDSWKRKRVDCSCRQAYNFAIGLRFGNIPPEFWEVETMDIVYNKENLDVIKEYCADISQARKTGAGFTMYGENGAGKTSMAMLILARALRQGYKVSYLTAHTYLQAQAQAWKDADLREWLDELVDADFLVLDELGKEYRSKDESRMADIDTLLRQRRGAMKPTIAITNFSIQDFAEAYGESIVSILSDRNRKLVYQPGDFRRRRRGHDGVR